MGDSPEQRLEAARKDECVLVPAPVYAELVRLLDAVPRSAVARDIATSSGGGSAVVILDSWYGERHALLGTLPKVP